MVTLDQSIRIIVFNHVSMIEFYANYASEYHDFNTPCKLQHIVTEKRFKAILNELKHN